MCLVLGQSLLQLYKAGYRLDEAKKELGSLQKEGKKLNDQLVEVQSPDFVEKEARDILGMQKPGETVVIVPELRLPNLKPDTSKSDKQLPNWEKWWTLFK